MTSPLDDELVDEIFEGDISLFSEIMEILVEQLPRELEQIETLGRDNEWSLLSARVHRMRSGLVSVAALAAAAAAGSLERLLTGSSIADDGIRTEVAPAIAALVFEINALLAYYESGEWRDQFRS